MAEYIKRIDTFSDKMCEGIDCGVCPFYNKAGENDCQVVAFLRSIPAADVRPVVTCAECQHNNACLTQAFVEDCGKIPLDRNTFFCADGERNSNA